MVIRVYLQELEQGRTSRQLGKQSESIISSTVLESGKRDYSAHLRTEP